MSNLDFITKTCKNYLDFFTRKCIMKKKGNNKVTKQGWQYCNTCKQETWHTPKLGLVSSNKRLCTRCNSSNELNQNKDER